LELLRLGDRATSAQKEGLHPRGLTICYEVTEARPDDFPLRVGEAQVERCAISGIIVPGLPEGTAKMFHVKHLCVPFAVKYWARSWRKISPLRTQSPFAALPSTRQPAAYLKAEKLMLQLHRKK
jgi:hypothetical protein